MNIKRLILSIAIVVALVGVVIAIFQVKILTVIFGFGVMIACLGCAVFMVYDVLSDLDRRSKRK